MSMTQTRPIPNYAIDALKDRLASALRVTELPRGGPTEREATLIADVDALLAASYDRTQRTSPWCLARDAVAAAALTFLVHCTPQIPVTPCVGEFLVVLDDRGVSRAMLDINEVKASQEAVCSRAAASMQPMDLSESQASAMQQVLRSGLARPKIKTTSLPEYKG